MTYHADHTYHRMGLTTKLVIFFLVLGVFFYRKDRFNYTPKVHYPGSPMSKYRVDHCKDNCYNVGPYSPQDQKFQLYDRLSRKKINNYVLTIDNEHKIQVAFVDLGYASVINTNFFSGQLTRSLEQMFSFSLPENMNDHASIQADFSMVKLSYIESGNSRIKTTDLSARVSQGEDMIDVSIKYDQNQRRCATYWRHGIISYKCYAGDAAGTVTVNLKISQSTWLNKTFEVSESSSVAFDAFRASGWEWKWVWGMGAGVIGDNQNPVNFGINVGTINGLNEDVIHLNSTVIPLPGLTYIFDENSTAGSVIKFTSNEPQADLTFTVTVKEHKYKDMGVLKNDMVKFEGYWSGDLTDPTTGLKHKVTRVPGLLEAADSIF